VLVTTTRARPPRIPAQAARLRVPIWQRSQARMRERWGFDLGTPDMLQRVRTLVAEKPTDAERVLLLAAALSMSGEADLAEQQARRAVELDPELPRAHTTLATLLVTSAGLSADDAATARRDEGVGHARRAAELDGADPSILYNLGIAEWFGGERSAARTAFDRAAQALVASSDGGADAATTASHRGKRWWPLRRRA
jgi:Flp pilus assembly protein TadD